MRIESENGAQWRKTKVAGGGALALAGVAVVAWVVVAILKHPGLYRANIVRGMMGAIGAAPFLFNGAGLVAEGLGSAWAAKKRRQLMAKVTRLGDGIGNERL